MATIGQIQPFDPANERISTYLERAELFFQANGIEGDKKVPVLLSIIGETHVKDSGPVDTSFSEALRTKTGSNCREISVSPKEPAPTETVAEYEAELWRLVTHCAFGDYLSETI